LKAHEALDKKTKEKHHERLQRNHLEDHRQGELRRRLPMRNLLLRAVQMPVRLRKQKELKAKKENKR
jgi:hypothetical protein